VKTVLTIAGSDPSGGAGIQADLKTFHALDVKGTTAITAITAQNEKRFFSLNPVSARLLREQIHVITDFHKIDAIKIGMLGTEENVFAIYRFLEQALRNKTIEHVVLDPILKSTTGAILLEPKGVNILRQYLIPLVTIVTPNLEEAEILTHLKVKSVENMREAALHLHTVHKGVKAVLVKGGHLKEEATDVLYDGHDWTYFPAKRITAEETHGTGCVLSAAIAAHLARGLSIVKSVEKSKEYVLKYIKESSQDVAS